MRKVSRVVQTVRDAILVVPSIILISTDIGPDKEAANYFLAVICAVILALTIINLALNALKVKKKGYFYGNSIFQLLLGVLLTGLIAPLGIILLILNAAVLATLWEKKTPEQLQKHPPKPITRNHRIIVGTGVLVMLASIFLPWVSGTSFSLSGFYFGTADLTAVSGIIGGSAVITVIGLLTLVGTPVLLILGSLGLLRRMLAWVSGVFALVIGIGWLVTLTSVVGVGPILLVVGAIIVLSARFIAK